MSMLLLFAVEKLRLLRIGKSNTAMAAVNLEKRKRSPLAHAYVLFKITF